MKVRSAPKRTLDEPQDRANSRASVEVKDENRYKASGLLDES